MKEKRLMTLFWGSGVADIVTTSIGISLAGFAEIGILGSPIKQEYGIHAAYIMRTAVTAWMIGIYALTKTNDSRWAFSFEKAMNISSIISWAVVALNTVQISLYLYELFN